MATIYHTASARKTQAAASVELIGTFFLTLSALLTGNAFAVGLTLAVLVYTIGNISGCHINPAVTVGLMVGKRFPVSTGMFYIVAQIAGALLARLVAGGVGQPLPEYHAAGPVAELLGFGLLMLTIMAVTEQDAPQASSGIAIGGALAVSLLWSKGILNPAVAIAMGQALSPATWATVLGGILFASSFMVVRNTQRT